MPFPNNIVDNIFQICLGYGASSDEIYGRDVMVWVIDGLWKKLLKRKAFSPIKKYLEGVTVKRF